MAAILFNPFDPNSRWMMHSIFASLYEKEPFRIALRLKVWLDPKRLAEAQDLGKLMMGTWSDDLKRRLREIEPYRSQLKPAGPRNFHREIIHLHELPFDRLAERLRGMLGLLFQRQV